MSEFDIDKPRFDIDKPRFDIDKPRLDIEDIDKPRLDRPRLDKPRLDKPRLDKHRLDKPRLDIEDIGDIGDLGDIEDIGDIGDLGDIEYKIDKKIKKLELDKKDGIDLIKEKKIEKKIKKYKDEITLFKKGIYPELNNLNALLINLDDKEKDKLFTMIKNHYLYNSPDLENYLKKMEVNNLINVINFVLNLDHLCSSNKSLVKTTLKKLNKLDKNLSIRIQNKKKKKNKKKRKKIERKEEKKKQIIKNKPKKKIKQNKSWFGIF